MMDGCADIGRLASQLMVDNKSAKTITEALDLVLDGVSGNSFDVVAIVDGELVQIDFL